MEKSIKQLPDKNININKNINTNINLTHVPEQTELSITLYDKRIISNYNFSFEYLFIKFNTLNDFLKDLLKSFPDVKIKKYKIAKNIIYYIFHNNFFINLSVNNRNPTNINTSLYSEDIDTLDELYKIYLKYEDKDEIEAYIKLTSFSMTSQGITGSQKIIKSKNFENINEKFYPFLYIYLFMNEFIYGKENILILCGKPGTGKSKFANLIMKKLIQNPKFNNFFENNDNNLNSTSNIDISDLKLRFPELNDETIYYVSSAKDINMITTDSFWDKIKNQDLVIFDDLDFLLSSRKENREDIAKNQFLSHLLSFTDGIDDNKTKIIITTNQPFKSIDEALLRKGRLFGILEFRELTFDEALNIWIDEKLDEEEFEKIFYNKDKISHAELGEVIQNIKRNKKYILKKDYILDSSIDALKKAGEKRVGLI